jgi:hypothetical protein
MRPGRDAYCSPPCGVEVKNIEFLVRAIAQAVSRLLPTAATRVRARICAEKSGVGTGFLRVLHFPLPTFIPPVAPQSPSSITWGWYKKPVVALRRADSPSKEYYQLHIGLRN